jgi:hypothetical protein
MDANRLRRLTYKSANTDDGICVCEKGGNFVFGSVEKGKGKSCKNDRDIQPGYPSAFIGEPDFAFDPYRGGHLFGNTDLGRQVDGMIILHGGLLALAVRLSVRDIVRTKIACWPAQSRQKSKCGRREGEQNGMPWSSGS